MLLSRFFFRGVEESKEQTRQTNKPISPQCVHVERTGDKNHPKICVTC
jgi:hypothetical protein